MDLPPTRSVIFVSRIGLTATDYCTLTEWAPTVFRIEHAMLRLISAEPSAKRVVRYTVLSIP